MKPVFYILLLTSLSLHTKAGTTGYDRMEMTLQQEPVDSSNIDTTKEGEVIEELIKTKESPPKEKVQYISQVTKYGFKNLFAQYSYNPSLPYSSQVNPNAEAYMQDYLKVHSSSLLKMKGWGRDAALASAKTESGRKRLQCVWREFERDRKGPEILMAIRGVMTGQSVSQGTLRPNGRQNEFTPPRKALETALKRQLTPPVRNTDDIWIAKYCNFK